MLSNHTFYDIWNFYQTPKLCLTSQIVGKFRLMKWVLLSPKIVLRSKCIYLISSFNFLCFLKLAFLPSWLLNSFEVLSLSIGRDLGLMHSINRVGENYWVKMYFFQRLTLAVKLFLRGKFWLLFEFFFGLLLRCRKAVDDYPILNTPNYPLEEFLDLLMSWQVCYIT